MASIKLTPDFKEFLRLLNVNSVEYLLIGGYAVAYYGYPRATADMDIWIAINPPNARRVSAAIKAFGFDQPDITVDIFLKEEQIVRMGMPPVRIEIITSITGVDFSECYQSKVVDSIDGVAVNIISLEKLKQNKRAAGRHKDLDDLENLPV